jgi:hypothetical protein
MAWIIARNCFSARSGQHVTRIVDPGCFLTVLTAGPGRSHVGIDVAVRAGMRVTASFDLWSTEQVLLVYERYFGKLDPKARRRIVEDARLNGWDRSWGHGAELLAA